MSSRVGSIASYQWSWSPSFRYRVAIAGAGESEMSVAPVLQPPAFEPLPLGSIKPAGWLKDQLRIQAAGLSGHLDEFWPDIKDSAWFGGKAEGWERVPYWLDGIVPLAYLLDDPALKAKVKTCRSTPSWITSNPTAGSAPWATARSTSPTTSGRCSRCSRRSRNTRRPPAILVSSRRF